MKKILYILLCILSTALVGCNNTGSGWVELEDDALFVTYYGQSATTTFTHNNMLSFGEVYYPDGWTIEVSLSDSTITVTAPDDDSGEDQGEVTLSGFDESGDLVIAYLLVAKTEYIALDSATNDRQSNCMILTEPNKIYTFNPNRRGELLSEQTTKAVSCEIIWRTANQPVGYPKLYSDGSTLGVYTNCDSSDVDEDNDETDLVEGNALIVTYDAAGNILWSWHLWITENDPTDESNIKTINGVEFLPRNLGAATNSVDSDDDILTSYGLYYQWGRREPFAPPYFYNAASSEEATLTNGDGDYIPSTTIDVSPTSGTHLYARTHPNVFIMGRDWLYNSDDALWGADGEKSIYDPSPKGWRVPSALDLADLTWSGDNYGEEESLYGMTLNGDLFMALGRKVYYDGSTQIVSSDGTFGVGSGYYWSRDPVISGKDAIALHFYIDRTESTSSEMVYKGVVEGTKSMQRGNGMQIRCVRDN